MSSEAAQAHPARTLGGVNVVGYLAAELGVGEAARRLSRAVELTGMPVHQVGLAANRVRHEQGGLRPAHHTLRYRDTIYSLNADELIHGLEQLGQPRYPAGDRRFGYWFWEVDTGLDHWVHVVPSLDEVWVASEFVADTMRPYCDPRLVPLPVWQPAGPTPYRREHLGLPEGFVFLYCFDFHSVMQRKNPLGAIDAYTRAFGPDDGTSLVLKSTNGHHHPEHTARLAEAAAGRPDIHLVDGYLSAARMQGLIEQCDCFVSLHRSEGFGLNIATALAAGKPVVATGWSGNMTFMDHTGAFVVPYDLVEVGPGADPYPASAHWAEPRLDEAAAMFRTVVDQPAVAAQRAAAGRAMVLDRQSPRRAADVLRPVLLGHLDHFHPDRPGPRPPLGTLEAS